MDLVGYALFFFGVREFPGKFSESSWNCLSSHHPEVLWLGVWKGLLSHQWEMLRNADALTKVKGVQSNGFSKSNIFPTPIFLLFVFLVSSSKRGNTSPSDPSAYEHHFNSFVNLFTVHSLHKTSIQVPMWQSLKKIHFNPAKFFWPEKGDPISLSLVIFRSSCFFFLPFFPEQSRRPNVVVENLPKQIASSNGEDLLGEGGLETKQRSLDSFQQLTFTWAHEHDNQVKHTFPWSDSPFFGKKSSNHPLSGATVSLKEGHPQSPLVLEFDDSFPRGKLENSKKQKAHSYNMDGFYWWSVQNF